MEVRITPMSLSIWEWQLDLLDFKKIRLEKEIEEIRFIFKSIEVQCNEDLKNRCSVIDNNFKLLS